MKKFLIITILTLSTTMASAKPADALPVFLVPIGSALWSLIVPSVSISGASTAIVGTGARIIVKEGAKKVATRAGTNQTVKHSSGQLIDKAGGKYLHGTTRPSF